MQACTRLCPLVDEPHGELLKPSRRVWEDLVLEFAFGVEQADVEFQLGNVDAEDR